jgi:succinyl-CoA synthetase beta subunit
MKLQEYHAKRLLLAQGLPVPDYSVAENADQAKAAAAGYLAAGAGRVVIKAQVLVGGRGKAGGVKLASSADEAAQIAGQILGMDIKGTTVQRVLVGPAADITAEYYLACVLDRTARKALLMGSAEGGVEIEVVAAERPDAIKQVHAHPLLGLTDYQARRMAFALGLGTSHLREFVAIAKGLFATMLANDADLVEINPLAIVGDHLECLDAKITIDDSALERHPDVEAMRDIAEEDPVDVKAREQGLSFIRLDGNIGCMVNGAGLAMTTMDLIKRAGGEPANFLDIGGGAKADKVAAAMSLILGDASVKAILVNIFGGIARGDEVAHGLVEARRMQSRHVPMVVRIVGTNADEAARILAEAGDPDLQTAGSLDEAVEKAVAAATQAAVAA